MSKRFLTVLLGVILCLLLGLSACVSNPSDTDKTDGSGGTNEQGGIENGEINKMYVHINGNKLEVTLVNNSSVDALVELLRQGDITYTADDYGNFEKVGNIGHSLPRNDTQINTEAGDVILYQGNNICLYYGNNSWSFTRIGKIEGYSASELRTLLGAGNGSMQVTLSLK